MFDYEEIDKVPERFPKDSRGTYMEFLSKYQILIKHVKDGRCIKKTVWNLYDKFNCKFEQPLFITKQAKALLLKTAEEVKNSKMKLDDERVQNLQSSTAIKMESCKDDNCKMIDDCGVFAKEKDILFNLFPITVAVNNPEGWT